MHELAQHALQPRNHASPSPTAAQDPRFQPPAGCRRAHTGQHRHLATSSLRQRAPAGRTPLANRPRAGPSAHSIAHPLHFNTSALGPGTPRPRPFPQARDAPLLVRKSALSWPGERLTPRQNQPLGAHLRSATPDLSSAMTAAKHACESSQGAISRSQPVQYSVELQSSR